MSHSHPAPRRQAKFRPWVAAAWCAAGAGSLWGLARITRGALIRRYGCPARRTHDPHQVPADAVDVEIPTHTGATLRGWWRAPAGTSGADGAGGATGADDPGPVALIIHGWGANAADMVPLSQPLLEAGLRVLLLDARGHGRSDDAGVASMPSFAEDIRSALRWLRSQPEVDPQRIAIVGHSIGAGAALFAAADDPDISGVVSLASLATPGEFMAKQMRGSLPRPLIRLALRYVEYVIGHRFSEFSPLYTIDRSAAPVLLIHGALDSTVPLADAERLHSRAPTRSTLVVLPDAGHSDVDAIEKSQPALLRFLRESGVIPADPDPFEHARATRFR